jgi:hypothetical protein
MEIERKPFCHAALRRPIQVPKYLRFLERRPSQNFAYMIIGVPQYKSAHRRDFFWWAIPFGSDAAQRARKTATAPLLVP